VVERLRPSGVELVRIDPASAEARQCLAQYFAELDARFRGGFEAVRDKPPDPGEFTEPSGCLFLARLDGSLTGCGALRTLAPGIGEIKRMWVSPTARGRGVGRSILERLESEARQRGMHTLRLDTNEVLTVALRLYRAAGYRETERFNDNPYAHHWFEKALAAT